MTLSKPNFPPIEGGYKYLTSQQHTEDEFAEFCVETADVINITDVEQNLLTVEFNGVEYEDIPLVFHSAYGRGGKFNSVDETVIDADEWVTHGVLSMGLKDNTKLRPYHPSKTNIWSVGQYWETRVPKVGIVVSYVRDEDGVIIETNVHKAVNIVDNGIERDDDLPLLNLYKFDKENYTFPTYIPCIAISEILYWSAGLASQKFSFVDLTTGEYLKYGDPTFTSLINVNGLDITTYSYIYETAIEIEPILSVTSTTESIGTWYYPSQYPGPYVALSVGDTMGDHCEFNTGGTKYWEVTSVTIGAESREDYIYAVSQCDPDDSFYESTMTWSAGRFTPNTYDNHNYISTAARIYSAPVRIGTQVIPVWQYRRTYTFTSVTPARVFVFDTEYDYTKTYTGGVGSSTTQITTCKYQNSDSVTINGLYSYPYKSTLAEVMGMSACESWMYADITCIFNLLLSNGYAVGNIEQHDTATVGIDISAAVDGVRNVLAGLPQRALDASQSGYQIPQIPEVRFRYVLVPYNIKNYRLS